MTKQLLTEAEALFKKLRAYLNGKKSQLDGLVSKDPIQEEIANLLAGRVGAGFSTEKLGEIFAAGEDRYKNKIPPGYEDAKKPEGGNRFGDLVIWLELLEKACTEKKAITFVTADEKEDWWRVSQGKTIGPRPELVTELWTKAGVELQMFSPERFMALAGEKMSQEVKPAAIKEVQEVRRAETSSSALDALRRLKLGEAARQQFRPSPEFLERLLESQDRIKKYSPPPEFLERLLESQDRIKEYSPPPEFLEQLIKNHDRIATDEQ